MKRNVYIEWIIAIIALVALASMIMISKTETKSTGSYKYVAEDKTPTDENAINVMESENAGSKEKNVKISYGSFLETYERTSYLDKVKGVTVTYDIDEKLTTDKSIYLLKFKMKSSSSAAKVDVEFGDTYTFNITTDWQEYYYPCKEGDIGRIRWKLATDFQVLYMKDVEVYEYDKESTNLAELKCGSYNLEKYKEVELDEEGLGIGKTQDVETDGEYLYSVGQGTLTIASIAKDGTTKVVGKLSRLGNVRHVEIYNKKLIAVSSRENGVYLVDVSNKAYPEVVSRYDVLEMAQDVSFASNYMFVASRYCGIEIVDISDTKNPTFVTRILNKQENNRCTVTDNYLYTSLGSAGTVEIYDISVIDNPKKVSEIIVDGKCGEVFVEENKLYIATGYYATASSEQIGLISYGTANGLEIYDITDKEKPVWESTVKVDGSLKTTAYADWSVKVSDGYAYFTNSYNGAYIYDVTNSKAPVRKAVLSASLYKEKSSEYVDLTDAANNVFPYDISKKIVSPATGIAVADGKIYISTGYTDVYEYKFKKAKEIESKKNNFEFTLAEESDDEDRLETYFADRDVNAVQTDGKYYYAGTDKGIFIFDESYKILDEIKTEEAVKDIKINNGYVVTAETVGVGIYKIKGKSIEKVSYYKSEVPNVYVSSVAVTEDGNYVISQSSTSKAEAISIRNETKPIKVTKIKSKSGEVVEWDETVALGIMYYNNIATNTLDGAIGIAGSQAAVWFKSDEGYLQVVNVYENSIYAEASGTTILNNGNALSVYDNGYLVYNPLEIGKKGFSEMKLYTIEDLALKGKPIAYKENVFVVFKPMGSIYRFRVNDDSRISYRKMINLDNVPGIPCFTDEKVIIPVRHGGIVVTELE